VNHPDWQWDEMKQVGTDFTDEAEVEQYDRRMAGFRDVDAENRKLLGVLGLPQGSSLLEIGCGTGRFSRAAAAEGLVVTAIDVSLTMIRYVEKKAAEEGLKGLATRHAGFLTMDFSDETFDAALSGAALHHLPDAWKLVGLRNVARVLKPGGQFLLGDVVFPTAAGEAPEVTFEKFVKSFTGKRIEAAGHVAREFSTYDWIMEGLLRRAGFDFKVIASPSESFFLYHCRKPGGP
jgi:putative AdoMet-dependent methyltransferase